jgi:hypothetical protein
MMQFQIIPERCWGGPVRPLSESENMRLGQAAEGKSAEMAAKVRRGKGKN